MANKQKQSPDKDSASKLVENDPEDSAFLIVDAPTSDKSSTGDTVLNAIDVATVDIKTEGNTESGEIAASSGTLTALPAETSIEFPSEQTKSEHSEETQKSKATEEFLNPYECAGQDELPQESAQSDNEHGQKENIPDDNTMLDAISVDSIELKASFSMEKEQTKSDFIDQNTMLDKNIPQNHKKNNSETIVEGSGLSNKSKEKTVLVPEFSGRHSETESREELSKAITKAIVNRSAQETTNSSEEKKQLKRIGEIVGERYKILQFIGHGGMGEVYKVEDLALPGQYFALKILAAKFTSSSEFANYRERFKTEIRMGLEFKHQHAIQIRAYDPVEFYYVMDYSQGKSLQEIITEESPFTVERALKITKQILSALQTAGEKNIVHRDIKPANIIIENRNGREYALILDFGIARISHKVDSDSKLTGNCIVGTPAYMSPEQCFAEELDHRSDLYSVGVVLYEMLTGEIPLKWKNLGEMFSAHTNKIAIAPSKLNSTIPKSLETIVFKAMEKNPDRRFANAREFIQAIDQLQLGWPKRVGMSSFARIALVLILTVALLSVYSLLKPFSMQKRALNTHQAERVTIAESSEQNSQATNNVTVTKPKATTTDTVAKPKATTTDTAAKPKATTTTTVVKPQDKNTVSKQDIPCKIMIIVPSSNKKKWHKAALLISGQQYKIRLQVKRKLYIFGYQMDSSHNIQPIYPAPDPIVPPSYRYHYANPVLPGVYEMPPSNKAFVLDNVPGDECFYFLYSRKPLTHPLERLKAYLKGKKKHIHLRKIKLRHKSMTRD